MKKQFNNRIKSVALAIASLFALAIISVSIDTQSFEILGTLSIAAIIPFAFAPTTKFEDFLASKNQTKESVAKLDPESQAELYNEYNSGVRQAIAKAIENKADTATINAMKSELSDLIKDQMDALNAVLIKQGLELKRLQDASLKGVPSKAQTIKEALTKFKENLKTIKEGNKGEAQNALFSFEIKAPAVITPSNISGGNVPVEDRIEGLSTIASREPIFLDYFSRRTTTSSVVSWVQQANKDGAAGQTAPGAAKNQIDFDLQVVSTSVKKTTAFIKVATEMIDDIEWMESEINNELLRDLLKKVEETTYDGDGTGQNHKGVYNSAKDFAAGAFAGQIDNANEVDVLTIAINQIEIAEQGRPTAIFMHPTDVTFLLVTKLSTTDKRYVDRLIQVASNLSLDGVPIVKTTLVTQGTFLVGNMQKAISVVREGVRVEMGLDADDFTKNVRTVLAEWRGLTIVKFNDASAFVKGDFATAKAALEAA